ncbi:MAG: hypothetical protein ACHQ50_18035, partial [Fimbriimonadales bacterium]
VGMSRSVALELGEFDAVVVHYSVILSHDRNVSQHFRDALKHFRGLKVQFMQDEYRWVDRATAASRYVGIDVLFTAAPEPAAGKLYDERLPGVRRVQTLTGYVPESLRNRPRRPLGARSIDVGYRGRDLPYWLGRLTQEKRWIAEGFQERARAYGLRTDIGWHEQDRIYGDRWVEFIASCRATLCTESGASIADFDGSAERAVRSYLRKHQGARYDEVADAVLGPYEGNVIVNVISPRVFEAASLGTGLVMFPGDYSGVVSPDVHYIVLKKDFSNMDEVVRKLRDNAALDSLTRRAFDDLVKSERWSYRTFIREFDAVISDQAEACRKGRYATRYRLAKWERDLRVPPLPARAARCALNALASVRGRDFTRRSEIESGAWLTKGGLALQALLSDRDLRSVYRGARRLGIPVDVVLEEILELHLLRQAARGALAMKEKFWVDVEFDPSTGSLRFVSVPGEDGRRETDAVLDMARTALLGNRVTAVEWDHRAVAATVSLERPTVDVGVGSDGLKSFSLLRDVGAREPTLLQHVLGPAIGPAKVPDDT